VQGPSLQPAQPKQIGKLEFFCVFVVFVPRLSVALMGWHAQGWQAAKVKDGWIGDGVASAEREGGHQRERMFFNARPPVWQRPRIM
jgi:hypothetical protein